jgi:predicted RNA polymerase sigma factor
MRQHSHPTNRKPVNASELPERDSAKSIAEWHGGGCPGAGLAALEAIQGLESSHLWYAALADNLRRLGRTSDAAGRLRTAVTLAPTGTEQRLLRARLSAVMPDPA